MSKFPSKITHSPNQEDVKVREKGLLVDAKTEMIDMLRLPDKDLKATIINMLQQHLKHSRNT